MTTAAASPYQLTPNLFAVSFGTAGLAQAWTVAADTVGAPSWPGNTLWIAAAAVWLVTLVAYVRNVVAQGRLRTELPDPVLGPFTALIVIVPMLLGIGLAPHARTAGETVFVIAFVLTVLLGGWLTGLWIRVDTALPQWHPGYFLPTVAGGLIAAGCSASLGWTTLAHLMLGYGLICWFILGSILLVRLFTQPMLPPPLLPTIAIEVAPPVVAGNSWFLINGNTLDTGAELLAGYAVLMILVQISMIGTYRRAPFGPAFWSFAFSYAAVVTNGVHWLDVEHVHGQEQLTYALLAVATLAFVVLAARTVLGLTRRTFLPRAPRPEPEPAS
ncbi:SLAC1 family transporter [Actinacidiphila rubida]|uniref:Tellurite resistance protein n=1 Tax=Actinacidiphila rubida TaxID=310780 RepID=A0A1H8KLL1_9ACTN|nr:TDT family transporter [Actinacidiphila rubida]SEN93839.1 tellurite resistance protein [Actinacidiphila rubida]